MLQERAFLVTTDHRLQIMNSAQKSNVVQEVKFFVVYSCSNRCKRENEPNTKIYHNVPNIVVLKGEKCKNLTMLYVNLRLL